MIVDRQTHTERQTDTIITILRAPYRGGGVINKSNFVKMSYVSQYRIGVGLYGCAQRLLRDADAVQEAYRCEETALS